MIETVLLPPVFLFTFNAIFGPTSWQNGEIEVKKTDRRKFLPFQGCSYVGIGPPSAWTRHTRKWCTSLSTTRSCRTKWTACVGNWPSWKRKTLYYRRPRGWPGKTWKKVYCRIRKLSQNKTNISCVEMIFYYITLHTCLFVHSMNNVISLITEMRNYVHQ